MEGTSYHGLNIPLHGVDPEDYDEHPEAITVVTVVSEFQMTAKSLENNGKRNTSLQTEIAKCD